MLPSCAYAAEFSRVAERFTLVGFPRPLPVLFPLHFARFAPLAGLVIALIATAASAQPARGTLVLTSVPAGALATLSDGTRLGPTPLVADVEPGAVRVILTLEGYADWVGETAVPAGGEVHLSAVLTATTGGVRAWGSGFGETIHVNGERVGVNELALVPVGMADVEVQVGGRTRQLRVPVVRDRETQLAVVEEMNPLALVAAVAVPGSPQWASGRAALGVPLTVAAGGGITAAVVGATARADARAEFDDLRDAYLRAETEAEAVRLRERADERASASNRAGALFATGAGVALLAAAVSAADAYARYRVQRVRVYRRPLTVSPTTDRAGLSLHLSL